MESTKSSNGHVSPVLAAVLDCFQSPPTTAYRAPHQDHPGREKMAAAILNAEDVIDPSRSAPPREFVGNELHNTPTSSPSEEAGNQGRTAAPALADWRGRCYVVRRQYGWDAISPGGKYWLSMDGRVWIGVLDTMNRGTFRTELDARGYLKCAPRPDDADPQPGAIPTTYHPRPKDAGARARQETIVRQSREVGCTERAADEKHMSAKERVLRSEPSHYCGATGSERVMREAEFARGELNAFTAIHLLAVNATNLDVLREQIRREMLHHEHLFSELNDRIKAPASAVVAA